MPRLVPALFFLTLLAGCATAQVPDPPGPEPMIGPPPTQPGPVDAPLGSPEERLEGDALAAHLRYLASDALRGRQAGTPGADSAAAYIARHFRLVGVQPLAGAPDYLQTIPFATIRQPGTVNLSVAGVDRSGEDVITFLGEAVVLDDPAAVFVGYGTDPADYEGVAGQTVIALTGTADDQSPQGGYAASLEKRQRALEAGAAALIEIYALGAPWVAFRQFIARPQLTTYEPVDLHHLWVADPDGALVEALQEGAPVPVALTSSGLDVTAAPSSNVVGVVPGTDPRVADEYVIAVAHYDHIGVVRPRNGAAPADSINNGARDNAMGTVAVMAAAEALAGQPARRPVVLLAVTAEEGGLRGSAYYVAHPLVPLDQTVYALNIDGAGYTDTALVTVIGLGRTTADPLFRAAAAPFGLRVGDDPAPDQGLFNRSDNVNFARAGIPAPTFSPGFTSFTHPDIARHYHQPADEADEHFDFGYLLRFSQAYARAIRLLADAGERPAWVPGDEYAPTPAGTE